MKLKAQVGDREIDVSIERIDDRFVIELDEEAREVDVRELADGFYSIISGGRSYELSVENQCDDYLLRRGAIERRVRITDPMRRRGGSRAAATGPEKVSTQMPGKVVRLLVEQGASVAAGQGLIVVEAMKMENEISASRDGRVTSVAVKPGETVERGATLLVIE